MHSPVAVVTMDGVRRDSEARLGLPDRPSRWRESAQGLNGGVRIIAARAPHIPQ